MDGYAKKSQYNPQPKNLNKMATSYIPTDLRKITNNEELMNNFLEKMKVKIKDGNNGKYNQTPEEMDNQIKKEGEIHYKNLSIKRWIRKILTKKLK